MPELCCASSEWEIDRVGPRREGSFSPCLGSCVLGFEAFVYLGRGSVEKKLAIWLAGAWKKPRSLCKVKRTKL